MTIFNAAPSVSDWTRDCSATDPLSIEHSWPGLAAAARGLGLTLDDLAIDRFQRYRDQLLERNTRVNLTAIRAPMDVERRLFLDALAMIPAIDAFLHPAAGNRHSAPTLIDIGSGAGFPGLALKIARPDLQVTLVDATAKKLAFLDEIIHELALDGVVTIHGRAEVLGRDPRLREQFAIATARAVAALPALLEYVTPFLDVGGCAFLPKGVQIDGELKAGRRAARRLGAEIISADRTLLDDSRLVIARKITLTPKSYPRRTGIPSQAPLGKGT